MHYSNIRDTIPTNKRMRTYDIISGNCGLPLLALIATVRIKCVKDIVKTVPQTRVSVWALRSCGFNVVSDVYIGEDLIITNILEDKSCRLFIGDRIDIAQRVTVIQDSDPNWSKLNKKISVIRGIVRIENDAWIGAGTIILPNVTIGSMSIVGAG